MKVTLEHNERIVNMIFLSVFPHCVKMIEKKGRAITELYQVIEWLTRFDELQAQALVDEKVTSQKV